MWDTSVRGLSTSQELVQGIQNSLEWFHSPLSVVSGNITLEEASRAASATLHEILLQDGGKEMLRNVYLPSINYRPPPPAPQPPSQPHQPPPFTPPLTTYHNSQSEGEHDVQLTIPWELSSSPLVGLSTLPLCLAVSNLTFILTLAIVLPLAVVLVVITFFFRKRLISHARADMGAPGPGPDTCLLVTDIQDSTHLW